MKIKTEFWRKPIPTNRFDWSAYDDDTYDGESGMVGYGPTEQDAINELMEMLEENNPVVDEIAETRKGFENGV